MISHLLALCMLACAIEHTFEINQNWQLLHNGKWLPVTVPGEIYTDLLRYNIIADPFYGNNEQAVRWVENNDWTYKTTFDVSTEELSSTYNQIIFDGIDTFAEVILNNVTIFTTDNMFLQWKVDVHQYLKHSNTLEVHLLSPVKKGIEIMKQHSIYCGIGYREDRTFCQSFIRKAPYHFGWDWGPSLVTSGIWRPVKLHSYDYLTIENVYIDTKSFIFSEAKNASDMLFTINVESKIKSDSVNIVLLYNQTQLTWNTHFDIGISSFSTSFEIDTPTLWWCNTLGTPYLYNYTLCVVALGSSVCKNGYFGVRTITINTTKDSIGQPFTFVLNKKPIFIRGSNLIPTDSFITRTTTSDLQWLLNQTVNSNMNMLRVWGGGVYQSDEFYDMCDKMGILVWQDFMFACAMYPAYEQFANSIKKEAEYNVKRLRPHPSLALWVGNNEIWVGYNTWPMPNLESWKQNDYKGHMKEDYFTIFNDILPKAVISNDPFRNYWPSSPLFSTNNDTFKTHGDVHYWSVWSGTPPSSILNYKTNVGRFMSEYGFQSMPAMSTIKQFDKYPDLSDDLMANHQKALLGSFKLNYYLTENLGNPHNLSEYAYWTEVMQSYALEVAITSHRIAMPTCMGTLYWQINDCWPVISWATIDYYKNWKPAHYKVRTLYSPTGVLGFITNKKIQLYLANDLTTEFGGTVIVNVYFTNGTLLMNSMSTTVYQPNTVSDVFNYESDEVASNYASLAVEATLIPQNGVKVRNCFFYEDISKINLIEPELKVHTSINKDSYIFTISTEKVAKNVYIEFEEKGEGEWVDNNVDILHQSIELRFKPTTMLSYIPKYKIWYLMPHKDSKMSLWMSIACIGIASIMAVLLIVTVVMIIISRK